ncbi:hypothetical protein TeGR_g10633, partial [Tetraparma gracilis]
LTGTVELSPRPHGCSQITASVNVPVHSDAPPKATMDLKATLRTLRTTRKDGGEVGLELGPGSAVKVNVADFLLENVASVVEQFFGETQHVLEVDEAMLGELAESIEDSIEAGSQATDLYSDRELGVLEEQVQATQHTQWKRKQGTVTNEIGSFYSEGDEWTKHTSTVATSVSRAAAWVACQTYARQNVHQARNGAGVPCVSASVPESRSIFHVVGATPGGSVNYIYIVHYVWTVEESGSLLLAFTSIPADEST